MNAHQYGNFSAIIRQLLDFAVDSEIINKNLFLDVKVNRRRVLVPEVKKPDHTQVFTKAEENMIVDRAWTAFRKNENYVQWYTPLAIIFMFYTGKQTGPLPDRRNRRAYQGNIWQQDDPAHSACSRGH